MTNLEDRLLQINLKLLKKEVINGVHAGKIYRIEVLDGDHQKHSLIYKEFEANRNNEIAIYRNLTNYIKQFSKVVSVWESSPEAILMCDLKSPLKKEFDLLSYENKTNYIERILEKLADLHSTRNSEIINQIPTHQFTSEWLEWCLDQLEQLSSLNHWADTEWIKTIEEAYKKLDIRDYKVRCAQVITHGDPHLENIFYMDEQIWFIDWEWAALGSPLRDITILCQDIYDPRLIQLICNTYQKYLNKENLTITSRDYQQDFHYLYIDHTTMMLAWEIEKYFQGYTSKERIQEIIDFKIGEIKRVTEEESSLFH
ncbi:phosphotransferase family protein [Rossellomorea sp. NS-SX7]|uniref:phosphotransferase family protein n=1 Tax=Rossellomorea sp. NS-SX7 TaxID=3463856 RepID=UPI004058DAF6